MAQLTVYIDDETRTKIEVAAKRAETSVSRWVRERLSSALETEWPDGYFNLIGSLKGVSIKRPAQLRSEDDVTREAV